MATLKELREEAKKNHIPNWWNKTKDQLTNDLAAVTSVEAENENVDVPETEEITEPVEAKKYRTCVVDETGLSNYCREHNLPYHTIYDRIYRMGWDLDKALNTPVRKRETK